ncbi:hypothetical protein Emag_004657 [Eimeria magna]
MGFQAAGAAAALPETLHEPMGPTDYGPFQVSVETNIGGRKHQEDRFTVCPRLVGNRNDVAFFGVFDGTVGDFASETVKDLVVPHLVSCHSWQRVLSLLGEEEPAAASADQGAAAAGAAATAAAAGLPAALSAAVQQMYAAADAELIELCRRQANDYASSTSVTTILAGGYAAVGHLGDSRVAIGVEGSEGGLEGSFLTVDHKPNMPHEQERIIWGLPASPLAAALVWFVDFSGFPSSGGSVEYLHNHNNKPFIRGGDFGIRKSKGEQPMQLQYSRAFGVSLLHLAAAAACLVAPACCCCCLTHLFCRGEGDASSIKGLAGRALAASPRVFACNGSRSQPGKDLKGYGLSCEPDVAIVRLTPAHRLLILATDGLWDVFSAQQAVEIAWAAHQQGENPSEALVHHALDDQQQRGHCADNITAMVVVFAA